MLFPVTDVVPPFLQRFPHPETPKFGELGIGKHIRRDQEQRATSGTTLLLPEGEVPLALRAFVAARPESQQRFLPRPASLCPRPYPDKLFAALYFEPRAP